MRILIVTTIIACLAACSLGEESEKVERQNAGLRNSPIILGQPSGQTKIAAEKFCYWNDKKYSDGASVCDAKRRFKCWGDKWVDIGNC